MKWTLLFGIIGVVGLILIGYMHEQNHVNIMEDYGIESKVYYFKYFPDFVTEYEKPCPNDVCKLANEMIDNLGYHLLPFYLLFFMAIEIGLLIIEDKYG